MKQLRVGIVGSGLMGQEIGGFLAERGYPILLKGRKEGDIQNFLKMAHAIFAKQKRSGKISQNEFELRMSRTQGTIEFDSRFADLDLVIESVVENMAVKRELFNELEERCSAKTTFCSNTSTLSVAEIASVLENKERFLGIHFFHPMRYFKFVEVIPQSQTSKDALQLACSLVRDIGKKTLLVKDSPGFFFNRIMMTSYMEVYYALESGWYRIEEIDEMFKKSNFMLGPLQSLDMMGIDIFHDAVLNLFEKMPERYAVPSILTKMVEMGRLGKKTGKGFYNYEDAMQLDDEMRIILETYRSKRDESRPAPFSLDQCLLRIMNEAAYCIEEGIVTQEDAEAIVKTVPPFAFTNGLFKYMDTLGLDIVVKKLRDLRADCGERFKPAPMITELVEKGWLGVKTGRGFFAYK